MLYFQFERDELIKYEIFPKIRIIRSVRRYQESLWWKLPVLLSSCLKDFPNDNGNEGFRGLLFMMTSLSSSEYLCFSMTMQPSCHILYGL